MIKYNDAAFICADTYRYNSKLENYHLLSSIDNNFTSWLDKYTNATLFSGGDFNIILDKINDK